MRRRAESGDPSNKFKVIAARPAQMVQLESARVEYLSPGKTFNLDPVCVDRGIG